jgi:hypothetical protein
MRPLVRALIVTDDSGPGGHPHGGFLRWQDQADPDATGPNSREFHLGEFVSCLQGTAWVGFNLEITKAHRAPAGTNGMNEAALKADRGADVIGFRFDQPFLVNGQSRTLSDYDMALFFAVNPANPDAAFAAEAEAIAQFMEDGGGFFATGDHANLGGQLAGLVPRVRSMRRWWWPAAGPGGEPAAPDPLGAARHDTTRSGPDGITNFEDQSDDVPQVIAPLMYDAGFAVVHGFPAHRHLPHPLLCSPIGIVNVLPDHMHEGQVEVPGNLAARTFMLNGGAVREYPDYTPPNPPSSFVPQPLAPEVVATGTVLPGVTSPALDPAHTGASTPANGVTFGVIGAWDGHRVDKGRVVVDSTWHHFFDINLSGDRYLEDDNLPTSQQQKLSGFYVLDANGTRVPNAAYRMIQWYYRNIVYWLIPARRASWIWWHGLAEISAGPQLSEELGRLRVDGAFRELRFDHYLYFGQLAEEYLAQARGHCATHLIHRYLYKPKIPWWEWVESIVDVWDPVRELGGGQTVRREQWLGALGLSARPELAGTLALGAAMATVVSSRELQSGDPEDVGEDGKDGEDSGTVEALYGEVLAHAVGDLGHHLKGAGKVSARIEKLVAEQLQNG